MDIAIEVDVFKTENIVHPHYSTDIAAAWLVVDEMRKKGYAFYFEHQQDDSEYPLPFAMFSDKECNVLSTCVAETAPLAICRALLMAVML